MTEIKYLRPELLEAIARNTLKKYDSSLILGYEAKSVPIEDIIESLGLTLEYQYIRKNGRILGETVFDDDYIPIYNMERSTVFNYEEMYSFGSCKTLRRSSEL